MDWKVFGTTFIAIFVAEMGDKTQLAAMALSSEAKSVLPVLLGAIAALVLASVLGVFAGKLLGSYLRPEVLKYASGILFIAIGLWTLLRR